MIKLSKFAWKGHRKKQNAHTVNLSILCKDKIMIGLLCGGARGSAVG
jgi:hypothetical protein